MAQGIKEEDQRHAEVVPGKFPEGGKGGYAYAATRSAHDA